MIDVRNVVFPMTAGDLVQSAVIVAQGGNLVRMLEVLDVGYESTGETWLTIKVRDQLTDEEATLKLKPDTAILVTGITRS